MSEARDSDHHAVERALRVASEALAAIRGPAPAAAPDYRAASGAIERLEVVLVAHFRDEESDTGFFVEVLRRAPHHDGKVAALQREHPVLADAVRSLAEQARWAGMSGESWERIHVGFQRFTHDLVRHEHTENALVSEALLTDEGGLG